MSDVDGAARLLRALAHPVRLRLVLAVEDEPRCVHELVAQLGAPQPLVSQHLRTLRDAGLLAARRRGREIEYSLADEHVLHIVRDAVDHAGELAAARPSGPP